MIAYARIGGIVLAVVLLFGAGWHFGGMASKTTLEGFEAAQAENTAKAVLAERASAATELARVNGILKGYQDAPIDPVSVGLAHRVFVYANTSNCPVSATGAHPAATGSASPEPRSDPSFIGLAQGVIDACSQDAAELTALQAAWPR